MNLLLDASVLIAIQKRENKTISKLDELKKIYPQIACVSFINYFEFYYGLVENSTKNRENLIQFLNQFVFLKGSIETAQILAQLKKKYDKKGVVIGLADLITASHAKEHNLILITKDKVFEKIDDINKILID